ncbi:MAG: hypothetical protein HKM07_01560 [Chlamydiae bacterium]|nr:hypothetical protein [Chlamydiota bacterium]
MNFLTVKQFADKHPIFTEAGLRWLLFRDSNFRKICCRKLGRRVLLNEEDALSYINAQKENDLNARK